MISVLIKQDDDGTLHLFLRSRWEILLFIYLFRLLEERRLIVGCYTHNVYEMFTQAVKLLSRLHHKDTFHNLIYRPQ